MSFGNNRKTSFLNSIPITSLDDDKNNLAKRCKFNFSYNNFPKTTVESVKEPLYINLFKSLNLFSSISINFSITDSLLLLFFTIHLCSITRDREVSLLTFFN